MKLKFLFYIEREFHISLFTNLIHYIGKHDLGQVGIFAPPYRIEDNKGRSFGARRSVITEMLGSECPYVTDPQAWKPDITFVADTDYEAVMGLGSIVSIGHGTICKGSFYMNAPLSFRENAADLICVPGHIHRERLASWVDIPIEVTGIPKLDPCFDGSLTRDRSLRALGLDPSLPTVLAAPTFNPEYSVAPALLESQDWILPGVNYVVKLHGVTPPDRLKAFEDLCTLHQRMRLCRHHDITPLLGAADVLISDVSSVVYEFLALRKPVLLYDHPNMVRQRGYHPENLEILFREVGLRFSDITQLPGLLNAVITGNTPDYDEIASRFVSVRDGSSSRRVVEAALALGIKQSPESILLILSAEEHTPKWAAMMPPHRIRTIIAPSISEGMRMLAALPLPSPPFITVIGSGWKPALLTPIMAVRHLLADPTTGIVFPMHPPGSLQPEFSIDQYFPQTRNLPYHLIGGPLTYQNPGASLRTSRVSPEGFTMRTEILEALLHEIPDAFDHRPDAIYPWMRAGGKTMRIAKDCFIYPIEEEV